MHNLSQFFSILLNFAFFSPNTFFSIGVPGQFISIFPNFAFFCIILHDKSQFVSIIQDVGTLNDKHLSW